LLLRAFTRLLRTVDESVQRMAPHTDPILERAARIAEDAAAITYTVRKSVDSVEETVDQVNRHVREAADETESRVRRFGSVLRLAQAEAEGILIHAAAAVRGLHATADALRARRTSRGGDGRGSP